MTGVRGKKFIEGRLKELPTPSARSFANSSQRDSLTHGGEHNSAPRKYYHEATGALAI
jgi:hypothetical protein